MGRFHLSRFMNLCTLKHTSTKAMPFSIFYGTEVIVPNSNQCDGSLNLLRSREQASDSYGRIYDIEALEEMRHITENKWLSYQKHISNPITKA